LNLCFKAKGEVMDKERLIKRIEENFDDMEDALIKNYHLHYVQLFRDYTEEIIKIIEEEMEK
jgi:hypothetical protein